MESTSDISIQTIINGSKLEKVLIHNLDKSQKATITSSFMKSCEIKNGIGKLEISNCSLLQSLRLSDMENLEVISFKDCPQLSSLTINSLPLFEPNVFKVISCLDFKETPNLKFLDFATVDIPFLKRDLDILVGKYNGFVFIHSSSASIKSQIQPAIEFRLRHLASQTCPFPMDPQLVQKVLPNMTVSSRSFQHIKLWEGGLVALTNIPFMHHALYQILRPSRPKNPVLYSFFDYCKLAKFGQQYLVISLPESTEFVIQDAVDEESVLQ